MARLSSLSVCCAGLLADALGLALLATVLLADSTPISNGYLRQLLLSHAPVIPFALLLAASTAHGGAGVLARACACVVPATLGEYALEAYLLATPLYGGLARIGLASRDPLNVYSSESFVAFGLLLWPVAALYAELLIGVTHFFRDPDTFEALDTQVLAPLMNERREPVLPLLVARRGLG